MEFPRFPDTWSLLKVTSHWKISLHLSIGYMALSLLTSYDFFVFLITNKDHYSSASFHATLSSTHRSVYQKYALKLFNASIIITLRSAGYVLLRCLQKSVISLKLRIVLKMSITYPSICLYARWSSKLSRSQKLRYRISIWQIQWKFLNASWYWTYPINKGKDTLTAQSRLTGNRENRSCLVTTYKTKIEKVTRSHLVL